MTTQNRASDSNWQPVLEGADLKRARGIIGEIEAVLCDPPPAWTPQEASEEVQKVSNASLADGWAGLAVFYGYLHHACPDKGYDERAISFLEGSIAIIGALPTQPSLYSGFTGVAWTIEHLQGSCLTEEDEDPNESIDQNMQSFLEISPWPGDYDLISGLVGFGVYALERWRRPSGARLLEIVIDRLDEIARRKDEGITWFTPPELLPEHQRKKATEGYYNLGLAHGMPAVIALLGMTHATGIATDKVESLLEGGVNWLLAQDLHEEQGAFGTTLIPGKPMESARSAWCYGDPGAAAGLLVAARAAKRRDWEDKAIEIFRRNTSRTAENSGVIDTGLCHGAAGLALVYDRMYHTTGEEFLKDAARFWYRQTMEMRLPDHAVAGFPLVLFEEDGGYKYAADPGILTGAAGVGLALLAATTNVAPDWDRFLMLSSAV